MLISQCKCGYESDTLYLGGGMLNFHSYCEVPCYCDDCEIVFSRNIFTVENVSQVKTNQSKSSQKS